MLTNTLFHLGFVEIISSPHEGVIRGSFCSQSQLNHSATTRAAVTHRPRTILDRWVFSIARPSVWNSLPQSLRL